MMRRICCFCESWESGGIESFLNNVLLRMDFAEMEVDIVAACIKESVFTERLQAKGIRFVQLSGKLRSPQNYKMFRTLLRERTYDVVHCNLFQGLSLYYVQIAKEEGVPIRIAHSHGAGLRDSKTKQIKLALHEIGKALWRKSATDFWSCSKPAAEFLLGDAKYLFIPNAIDTRKFRYDERTRKEIRDELGISDKILIGTVGRLNQEKNHIFLLKAFHKYQSINPNSFLLLVGDGEERRSLIRQTEELGIADSVIFYGTTVHVNRLLCAMDLFVFPSIFEGLGIAAIEAQAAGLPVLCSDGVPQEAKILPSTLFLPLSAGETVWANTIKNMISPNSNRESCALTVNEAGFDIGKVSSLVSNQYKNLQ